MSTERALAFLWQPRTSPLSTAVRLVALPSVLTPAPSSCRRLSRKVHGLASLRTRQPCLPRNQGSSLFGISGFFCVATFFLD